MDKKKHALFFDKSPFSPPWDKHFCLKQQNSLIGSYEGPKYRLKYTLGVLVDLNLH